MVAQRGGNKGGCEGGSECESQGGRRSPNPGCTPGCIPGWSQMAKKVEKRSGSLNKKVTDLRSHADI